MAGRPVPFFLYEKMLLIHANQLFWNTTFFEFSFCLEIFRNFVKILMKFRQFRVFENRFLLEGRSQKQNRKSQNPRQKQKQCQVPDSCPLPGSTRWPKPHSRLAASLPTPRYRLYGGVWLLILWVAPRLNSRAEPEHYIQALAPAEARKNEGVVRDPSV